MKKINCLFWLILIGLVSGASGKMPAQTGKKSSPAGKKSLAVGNARQTLPRLQCTTQNAGNQEVTYLVGAGKLTRKEKKRIEKTWGTLIVPQGETVRAREIRQQALDYKNSLIEATTKSLETWKTVNPGASAEQIEKQRQTRQEIVDYTINKKGRETEARIQAKNWDWRNELDVGAVMNQGLRCNTCWALAATDAAAVSLQKSFLETMIMRDYLFPDKISGELSNRLGPVFNVSNVMVPFVQDLLNCMPIVEQEICRSGWHGRAFEFMVQGPGMPMTFGNDFVLKDEFSGKEMVVDLEYKPNKKFTCQPSAGFKKAGSWDYVNSPPDKLPSVEQLKTALIEHGPLVAPIVYDDCLARYKGGVFNEQNLGMINHVVLLVGWDDDKSAWLVKNSWGPEWGEQGFAWIRYGSNNIGVFAAWIDAGYPY